jgi:hypothetical protein
MSRQQENKRAERIAFRMSEYHSRLDNLYECLTDRDLRGAESDIKFLISELKITLKALEEDDF